MKPSDYIWIERWGRFLGSYSDYISDQQKQAAAEGAPPGAIFKRHNSEEWAVISEVENPATQAHFEQYYAECREEGFWGG